MCSAKELRNINHFYAKSEQSLRTSFKNPNELENTSIFYRQPMQKGQGWIKLVLHLKASIEPSCCTLNWLTGNFIAVKSKEERVHELHLLSQAWRALL